MLSEDKAIEFLMSVKAEAIKAAFGICSLPEKELFQRLETLYMKGVDAGVKLGAERARVVKPLEWIDYKDHSIAIIRNPLQLFYAFDRHAVMPRDCDGNQVIVRGDDRAANKAAIQRLQDEVVLSMLEPV